MKLNIANKVTVLRIILAFIIIALLLFSFNQVGLKFPKYIIEGVYIDSKYILAGILFIIASATDFLDGYLARKLNIVTDLGKMLDAIADKVLVNSVLIILSSTGFIHPAITVTIIMRDIFTNTIKMVAGNKGNVVAAIKTGKYKTAFLMIGITLTLFYNMPFEIYGFDVANFFLIAATVLAVLSGIEYYNINKKYITQD